MAISLGYHSKQLWFCLELHQKHIPYQWESLQFSPRIKQQAMNHSFIWSAPSNEDSPNINIVEYAASTCGCE